MVIEVELLSIGFRYKDVLNPFFCELLQHPAILADYYIPRPLSTGSKSWLNSHSPAVQQNKRFEYKNIDILEEKQQEQLMSFISHKVIFSAHSAFVLWVSISYFFRLL